MQYVSFMGGATVAEALPAPYTAQPRQV